MHKVLLCGHLDEVPARWLAKYAHVVSIEAGDRESLLRELPDAEGLIVRSYTAVDSQLLSIAHRLKVIGRPGVGLDHIDLAACTARGIRVVHTPDANSEAVVEYVWSLILQAVRPVTPIPPLADEDRFHDQRRRQTSGRQLSQRVMGILGMGRIGRRVAHLAQSFGMRVLYNDLLREDQLSLPNHLAAESVAPHLLWKESDILSLHIDGREGNRHLIDSEVLNRLKPDCMVINTSRGNVIDANALAQWARSVQSRGGMALLDVHDPEPPPKEYPLWNRPNVKLFAHLGSRTSTAQANMSWVVKDVMAVLEGNQPVHPAN